MFKQLHLFLSVLILATATLLANSCSSVKTDAIQEDSDSYKLGYPEFHIGAFGFIDEKRGPILEVNADIVMGSLVYQERKDSLTARFIIDIQVTDLSNGENVVLSKQVSRQIVTANENIVNSEETEEITKQFQVSPSNYQISVTVQDLNSKQNITQTTDTYIPETKQGNYTLSSIQMFGKKEDSSQWHNITSYHVPSKIDSLRFIFQVISSHSESPMILNSKLIRFRSDTTPPRAITRNNYSSSSIEYKGIDFDEKREIQSTRRVLTDYSSVFMEYKFENKQRGNYRFEVTATKGDDENTYRARAFGVKSTNFPAILSPQELARPLIYLMGRGDHESLMKISSPDSLKAEIDRFWLRNIGNKRKTKRVIELYYSRVEEANKLFSGFKEGWKTDRGMIYILFGNPFYTRDRLKELIWYYSYNLQNPEYRFLFEQPKLNNKFFPFDHYILQRNILYHNILSNQRGLWLSGRILQRQI